MTRKEVMQGGKPRPHQAALRGHAELSGFYSKSNRESSDLSGGMPGPDFHFERSLCLPCGELTEEAGWMRAVGRAT